MRTDSGDSASDLERRATEFLTRNFPQIRMHGGSASIEDLDPETGEITVRLGGACSGCGVSPMTIRAIASQLPDAIPEIETVNAETGDADGEGSNGTAVPGFVGDENVESPF